MNSEDLTDTSLIELMKKTLKNKGKRTREKQKEIYTKTKKNLMSQLINEESK